MVGVVPVDSPLTTQLTNAVLPALSKPISAIGHSELGLFPMSC